MGPQATFIAFRGRMLGRAIVHKRLFLHTLQLYLEPEPGVEHGLEVWCEPDWQVVSRDGVIAGSGTIDFDTEAEDPDALQRMVSKATDVLKGCVIEDVAVDARTFELEIELSGGLAVRTFVSDPTEPDQWLVRDPSAENWLSGTPAGLLLETDAERNDRRKV
jgi:hypothetical protein